jgi:hypothetical protein
VEHVWVRCAHGSERAAACITIRNDANASTLVQARVRACELEIGNWQIGLLVVNAFRAHIEDNTVNTWGMDGDFRDKLFVDPAFVGRLARTLISGIYVDNKNDPPLVAGARKSFGEVTLGKHVLHFRTVPSLKQVWISLLQGKGFISSEINSLRNLAGNPPPKSELLRARSEVQRRVRQAARQILVRLADPTNTTVGRTVEQANVDKFGPWFNAVRAAYQSVASQGIVVAGKSASDVRVLNNTVYNALEAIHLGFSHSDSRGLPGSTAAAPTSSRAIRLARRAAQNPTMAARVLRRSVPGLDAVTPSGAVAGGPPSLSGAAAGSAPGGGAGPAPGTAVRAGAFQFDTHSRDYAQRVQVCGNSIYLRLPTDSLGERHGVFVGNANSISVQNNFVRLARVESDQPYDAIRVYGKLGSFLMVSGNSSEGASVGVRVMPVRPYTLVNTAERRLMWLVAETMAADSVRPVDAPPIVMQRNNYQV